MNDVLWDDAPDCVWPTPDDGIKWCSVFLRRLSAGGVSVERLRSCVEDNLIRGADDVEEIDWLAVRKDYESSTGEPCSDK